MGIAGIQLCDMLLSRKQGEQIVRFFRAMVCAGLAAAVATAAAQSDSNAAAQNNGGAPAQTDDEAPPKSPACVPTDRMYQFHIIYKDRPYSGKRVSTCKVRLEDGTTFRATRTTWEWRDSEGRRRIAQREIFPEVSNRYHVTVYDPVAHISWTWSEGEGVDRTAVLFRYNPKADFIEPEINRHVQRDGSLDPPVIARMLNPDLPRQKQVILKSTTINGVWAEGDRLYQIANPGEGNNQSDHQEVAIDEFWDADELMEEVRHISDDPELGKTTINLVDIDQSEPDAALFRPPKGYGVLEATPQEDVPQPSPLIVVPAKQ
jgi:hypothetical protein